MQPLIDYIVNHTQRGECQCGSCCDKLPNREAPTHSADVCFFWVSTKEDPTKEALLALLEKYYPEMDRLRMGPSYIEIGAALGSQQVALLLLGLGELVGLWEVISPKTFGITDPQKAQELAGWGFVMCSGVKK